jgi:hypothetical protein
MTGAASEIKLTRYSGTYLWLDSSETLFCQHGEAEELIHCLSFQLEESARYNEPNKCYILNQLAAMLLDALKLHEDKLNDSSDRW